MTGLIRRASGISRFVDAWSRISTAATDRHRTLLPTKRWTASAARWKNRGASRSLRPLATVTSSLDPAANRAETDEAAERSLQCLTRCLNRLKPEDRNLIVEYYRDGKRQRIDRRRELARGLGITMNALAIRTWRLR